jgi:hypothetical protein
MEICITSFAVRPSFPLRSAHFICSCFSLTHTEATVNKKKRLSSRMTRACGGVQFCCVRMEGTKTMCPLWRISAVQSARVCRPFTPSWFYPGSSVPFEPEKIETMVSRCASIHTYKYGQMQSVCAGFAHRECKQTDKAGRARSEGIFVASFLLIIGLGNTEKALGSRESPI